MTMGTDCVSTVATQLLLIAVMHSTAVGKTADRVIVGHQTIFAPPVCL